MMYKNGLFTGCEVVGSLPQEQEVAQENDCLEYKSLWNKDTPKSMDEVLKLIRNSRKEFNAFLNSGGGEVHFGFRKNKNDGLKTTVAELGIPLNKEGKHQIKKEIQQVFRNFWPSCSSHRGVYQIEWEVTDWPSDCKIKLEKTKMPYRFSVIVNKSSAYKYDHFVCMRDGDMIKAFTRAKSHSVPMTGEMILEKLRQAQLVKADQNYVQVVQAHIDAGLIQKLRDVLHEYENGNMEATGIISILQKYATEIPQQWYISDLLLEEVLIFMKKLVDKSQYEKPEIQIAAEVVNLGKCIYYERVHLLEWYSWRDSNLPQEAGNHKYFSNSVQKVIVQLFEVCFSVAHNSVKYHHKNNEFAQATCLLAKILRKLQSAPEHEKEDGFRQCIKDLGQHYNQLRCSIQESGQDDCVQQKLLKAHKLLLQLYKITDDEEQFRIQKEMDLGCEFY